MRYIGSKENLLPFIHQAVAEPGVPGGTSCDLFAGTTAVGRYFKRQGYRVISNDLQEYAFVFGKAYIETNSVPTLPSLDLPAGAEPARLLDLDTARLEAALAYLNGLPPEQGF